MSTDVWGIIHGERQAPATDLQGLTDPLMAMTGRTAATEDLTGDGVATLRSRG